MSPTSSKPSKLKVVVRRHRQHHEMLFVISGQVVGGYIDVKDKRSGWKVSEGARLPYLPKLGDKVWKEVELEVSK
jgi:hypothetical protein